MRTEKIGLAVFLHAKKVPGVQTAECFMHMRVEEAERQTRADILPGERKRSKRDVGGYRIAKMLLTTNAGLKASSKWLMRSDLLGLYSLAREQLHYRT